MYLPDLSGISLIFLLLLLLILIVTKIQQYKSYVTNWHYMCLICMYIVIFIHTYLILKCIRKDENKVQHIVRQIVIQIELRESLKWIVGRKSWLVLETEGLDKDIFFDTVNKVNRITSKIFETIKIFKTIKTLKNFLKQSKHSKFKYSRSVKAQNSSRFLRVLSFELCSNCLFHSNS